MSQITGSTHIPPSDNVIDANASSQPWKHQSGELLIHFAGRKKLKEKMEYWIDIAEQHLPEWEVPLEETWYEEDIKVFWDGFYTNNTEEYHSEVREIHDA